MNPYDLNDVSKEMNKKHKQKEVKKEYCEWKRGKKSNYYKPGCDKTKWNQILDFKYCPYCGKQIKEIKDE